MSWACWRGSCNCWSVCPYLQETLGRESALGFLDICEHASLPRVPLRGSFRHSVNMESCRQFEEKMHSCFEVNLASVFKEDSQSIMNKAAREPLYTTLYHFPALRWISTSLIWSHVVSLLVEFLMENCEIVGELLPSWKRFQSDVTVGRMPQVLWRISGLLLWITGSISMCEGVCLPDWLGG